MSNIEKNRKQRFTSLPISIKLVLKIVLVAAGFCLWGSGFVWVLLGLWLAWGIIKGVLSCLLSLLVLAGIVIILISIL